MHHPEGRGEIENGGNDRGLHDIRIGHVDILGHDEGDRAHDRGHDLPAHGRRGLDPACEGAAIAELHHQRNRELAHCHHIGDARARDRAHEGGGNHRHLRRPAARGAHEAQRHIVEELDHARALQKGAEQDEEIDIGRRNACGRRVDALGAEAQLLDDLLEIEGAMIEGARQHMAPGRIGDEAQTDQRQGRPHQTPRNGEEDHQRRHADEKIRMGEIARAVHQIEIEDPVVDADAKARQAKGPDGGLPQPVGRTVIGHQRAGHENQKAHMHGPQDLRGDGRENRRVDLEDREGHRDPEQQAPREALAPAAGQVMLDVEFAGRDDGVRAVLRGLGHACGAFKRRRRGDLTPRHCVE